MKRANPSVWFYVQNALKFTYKDLEVNKFVWGFRPMERREGLAHSLILI